MAKTRRFRSRRGRIALIIGSLVIAALVAVFAYRGLHSDAQAAVTYTTGTVERTTLTSSVSGTGNIELSRTTQVVPTVSGTVTGLSVGLGDAVRAGQTLFTLVEPQLDVAVAQAQNAYDKAVLGVTQAELDVLQAKKDLSDLYDRSHTSLQVKQAKAAISAAQLAVTAAENAVTSAEIALEEAKEDAAARTVIAPAAGVVTSLSIENGDAIEASGGGSTGSGVMTITDPDYYQATITLAESDIIDVEVGQKAILTFDALPDLTLSAKVTRMDSSGSNDQGVVSYNVVITPDVMEPSVKGGMTVSVSIITDVAADVLAVPSSAVKSSTSGKYVQVLQDGQPVNVTVETGLSNDSYTEIASGLTQGQEIVVSTSSGSGSATATAERTTGNLLDQGGMMMPGGIPPDGGGMPTSVGR